MTHLRSRPRDEAGLLRNGSWFVPDVGVPRPHIALAQRIAQGRGALGCQVVGELVILALNQPAIQLLTAAAWLPCAGAVIESLHRGPAKQQTESAAYIIKAPFIAHMRGSTGSKGATSARACYLDAVRVHVPCIGDLPAPAH